MPSSAPADGADKGTSEYDECTGGGSASKGSDPYVGRGISPSKEGGEAYTVTGGAGDKTGDGRGSSGPVSAE